MMYQLLADLVLLLHLAFVLFAVFGGLLVLHSRRWLFLHLPALVWAAIVEFLGLFCPLTPLENALRRKAELASYQGGFVEHYLLPVLYPADLTRNIQIGLGLSVLIINLAIYLWVASRLNRAGLRQCLTPPNMISLLRLAVVPAMLMTATAGKGGLFLGLLALALISDAVDGWLARRLGLCSELGAQLDSWGDIALLAGAPLGVWLLWPTVIVQERLALSAAGVALVLPLAIGLVKFGRLTSYHTHGAKISAVLLSCSFFLLLLEVAAWPFHWAVVFFVAAESEEIAITWVLPGWRADVASLKQALRIRQEFGR